MKRKMIYSVLAILALILLALILVRITRHFQMEACIKKGGYWDKELNKCVLPDTILQTENYIWHTVYDSTLGREYLEKGHLIDSISDSPIRMIDILNKRPALCKIEYLQLAKDTITIRITNEEVLTEQMGSTGAHCFLGETVFTLTENNSIKMVKINIKEGSHASPGTYSRANFKDIIQHKSQ